MTKRALILILIGLNLLLLAGVVIVAYQPPAAFAQRGPAPAAATSDCFVVSAESQLNHDAIYIVDVQNQLLHVFVTPFPQLAGAPIALRYLDTRDMNRDFLRQEGGRR